MRNHRQLRLATDANRIAPAPEETPSPIQDFLGFDESHARDLVVNIGAILLAALVLFALHKSIVQGK